MRIEVVVADITMLRVDAIVNTANASLLGGGGVDGAIHRAAGPALLEACRALPQLRPGVRCPTGEARITPGFALPAAFVIHAVGPVWHGGGQGEDELLRDCYRNSLLVAAEHNVRSIAFPAISCGAYRYPSAAAARIAVQATHEWTSTHDAPGQVLFCCFDAHMAAHYDDALQAPNLAH